MCIMYYILLLYYTIRSINKCRTNISYIRYNFSNTNIFFTSNVSNISYLFSTSHLSYIFSIFSTLPSVSSTLHSKALHRHNSPNKTKQELYISMYSSIIIYTNIRVSINISIYRDKSMYSNVYHYQYIHTDMSILIFRINTKNMNTNTHILIHLYKYTKISIQIDLHVTCSNFLSGLYEMSE